MGRSTRTKWKSLWLIRLFFSCRASTLSQHRLTLTPITMSSPLPSQGDPGHSCQQCAPLNLETIFSKRSLKSVQRRAHHTLHRQLVPSSKSHLPGVGPLLWTDLGHAVVRAVGLCDSIRDSRPEFATQVQDFLSGLRFPGTRVRGRRISRASHDGARQPAFLDKARHIRRQTSPRLG